MKLTKIINKWKCIINILLYSFLCLYFVKIDLAIGKTSAYHKITYINEKISLKQNTTNTRTANKKNKINQPDFLMAKSGNNDLSIWSNSFNFAKGGNSEVDPRTGTLFISMKVGSLQSNFGHGPDIDLEMNYNSNVKGNPDHLGAGWAWNLAHYNPATHQLNTAGGKSFFLKQQPDGSWHPLYHKLKDVIITNNEKGGLVIKSTNGLQDILDRDGYEIRMEQQNGDGVAFKYIPGSHILREIEDDNGHSIWLTKKNNYLTVTSYSVQGHSVNMRISLENNEVRNICFPESSSHQHTANHSRLVHLSYDTWHNSQNLLTGVHYFTGMKKEFTYDCSHEMELPNIINNLNPFQPYASICVVKQVRTIPGANQPPMNIDYSYTSTNSNNHDYLGFNAGLTRLTNLKTDILFETPASYTYQTKEDNEQVQTIRTYNKYHLLIDTKTVSDKTNKLLTETIVYFCRTDKQDGCANTSFNQLLDTYSLPLKVVTKKWGDNFSAPAITTVNRSYDDYGRLISQTDSYGRKTETVYCPQNGDRFCPAAPADWPVASLAEQTKKFPAPLKNSALLSPVITTMTYKKEDNRNKAGYTLVLYKSNVQSDNEQRIEIRQYYQDKNNPLTYGLLKQKQLTGMNLPAESVKNITHHYQYTLNKSGTETISDYIDTANNQSVSSSITEKSLFIPKTLRVISADKKNIQTFEYDELGRLTARTDATGTPFTATVRNQYRLSATENSVIVTAPNGIQKKLIFDGLGRKLATYIEKMDLQGHLQPGLWQQQTQISYNSEGEVAISTRYAENDEKKGAPAALTTRFDYDVLGRLIRKYLPDGETEVTEYDNAHRCVVHYTEDEQNNRTSVIIGLNSVTGKPTEQIILPATTGTLPSVRILCTQGDKQSDAKVFRMTYDGFDRLISTEDPMGRVVQKQYDIFGHVTDIINPVGDKLHNVYDLTGHVIQHLVMPKQGGQYLLASASFNAAGQKLWSSGEDSKKNIYHYNINGQLYYIYKPNGHHVTLFYNSVGLTVANSLDGKIFSQISYDHTTYEPLTMTDNTGVTTYHYRNDGLLESTIHKGINEYANSAETLAYNTYHHLVSRTDSQHNKVIYIFDKLVRPAEKIYQEYNGKTTKIEQLFYDTFSRVVKVVYGSGMIRMFTYDPWGQLKTIKDSINGKPLHTESFAYDGDGNITRLQRSDDQNHQVTINYSYDRMDNLVSMNCQGDSALCPHDTAFSSGKLKTAPAIIQQNYKFTQLNRIAGVTEKLLDTSSPEWHSLSKMMSYTYANAKVPLRLTAISTQWNNQQSETRNFVYDAIGNMIVDGEGNKITYNPFNQITRVVNAAGMVSRYDYDGQGKEVKIITKNITRQMIYQGGSLKGEIVTDTANNRHKISYPSAEIKTTDNTITDWNESNYKGDVISVLKQDKTSKQWTVQQHNIYSPYGMVWYYGKHNTTIPAFQQTLKGFDGEITDATTGWQFLGAGHRTYNPYQRYFVSEDPVGGGYAFGSNNPIMKSDPSGNMPKWLSKVFGLANTVFSLGMSTAHSKFFRGIGRSLMWGAMAVPFGPTLIGLSFSVPAALSFASSEKPANKGLQQASMITGNIYGGALFIAGLAAMGAGVAETVDLLIGVVTKESFGVLAEEGMRTAVAEVGENDRVGVIAMLRDTLIDHPTGGKLAVFICRTDENIAGKHELFDTPAFSEDGGQVPEHIIVNENNVESLSDEVADESYDAILQERIGDYFMLAYKMLKPGGRLYVLPQKEGVYADNLDFDMNIYKYIGACRGKFRIVGLNGRVDLRKFGFKGENAAFRTVIEFIK